MTTPAHPTRPRPSRTGFTIVELLVVLAIILLLIGFIWAAVGTIREQARTTSCLSNQRQLNLANYGFAADNNGTFMSPRSSPNTDYSPGDDSDIADCSRGGEQYRLFTQAHEEDGVDRIYQDNNGRSQEYELALTDGAAWPYLGSIDVYSSPLDPTNRIRSYAFNAYVGEICPDNLPIDQIEEVLSAGWRSARTLSGLPKPNETLMTICEEDADENGPAFNNQGWVVKSWTCYQGWWDYPAPWLKQGVTLSFADGSTEFYKYKTPDLGKVLIENALSGYGYHRATYAGDTQPYAEHNSDWVWFANHMLPGRIQDASLGACP